MVQIASLASQYLPRKFYDLPIPSSWPVGPNSRPMKRRALGISPDGLQLTGTNLATLTDCRRFRFQRPSWALGEQGFWKDELGADTDGSGRGINDYGDIVGFRQDSQGLRHAAFQYRDTPKGVDFDIDAAVGIIASDVLGITNANEIVGNYTVGKTKVGFVGVKGLLTSARVLALTISGSTHNAFVDKDSAGLTIPEDLTGEAINSNKDVAFTAQASVTLSKRSILGTMYPNQGWDWHRVSTSFVIPGTSTPAAIVISGMDNSGMVVGTMQARGANGLISAYYGYIDRQGIVSVAELLNHPSATDKTEFSGVSENGTICGQYDDIHPFVYEFPGPGITWESVLVNLAKLGAQLGQQLAPQSLNELVGPRHNAQLALQIHALIARINDDALRGRIEKPLLEYVTQQIRLLSERHGGRD